MTSSSPRFFVPLPLQCGTTLSLPEETVRHMRVLRLQAGATLTLFNGDGGEYAAKLQTITQKEAVVFIENYIPREAEAPYLITLAQGIAEQNKMEWLIEKAIELGIAEITPLLTARSVVRLDDARAIKRQARWMQIVRAASEQCGRNRLAQVNKPTTAHAWLRALPALSNSVGSNMQDPSQNILACPTRLLLSPRASLGLAHLKIYEPPPISTPITVLIGPEGGLTQAEENAAIAQGFTAFHLGPRILRTETAGIAVLASLAMYWPGADA